MDPHPPRHPLSFPTRRSSDLHRLLCVHSVGPSLSSGSSSSAGRGASVTGEVASCSPPRSEEHTSELQSRGHLVCRLLLEKKKFLLLASTSPTELFVSELIPFN